MKDDVYTYNIDRWEALAKANALFTRPNLELDRDSARAYLDLERLGLDVDLVGMRVLCLASGGGQQSAAFALLGADVTVLDISPSQLERDKAAAEHYGATVACVQGDMRDLSVFAENAFDIVWHPYSLNFVPDARVVFHEVGRVLREGGLYHLMCANPFFAGVTHRDWNGEGYTVKVPYEDEVVTSYPDQEWVYDPNMADGPIQEPKEYKQTMSRIMNSLIGEGFVLGYFAEVSGWYPEAPPGSWGHFTRMAPPWMEMNWIYNPKMRVSFSGLETK